MILQAESDHNVKDTYNYMTIQTDIRMPRRHFTFLEDFLQHQAFQAAISHAVAQITAEENIDCRVLNLGAGAGLCESPCVFSVACGLVSWLGSVIHARIESVTHSFTVMSAPQKRHTAWREHKCYFRSARGGHCCNLHVVASIEMLGLQDIG